MKVLAVLAFVAFVWLVVQKVKRKRSHIMDTAELKKQIDMGENPLIVDLRDEAEYRKGHIAGAVNIPIAQFERRIGEIENPGKKLALICKTQGKSMKAHGILAARNIGAFIVRGGMEQWQQNSFPTES